MMTTSLATVKARLSAFVDTVEGTHERIVITRNGFAPLSHHIIVTAGQPTTVDVRMPKQVSISEELTVVGRLSDYVDTSAGAPASNGHARRPAAARRAPRLCVTLSMMESVC